MAAAAFSKGGVAQGKDLGLVVEPVTLAEPATQTRLQVQIGSSDPLPNRTPEEFRAHHIAVAADPGNGQNSNPGLYS
jgi:hypothetical protein